MLARVAEEEEGTKILGAVTQSTKQLCFPAICRNSANAQTVDSCNAATRVGWYLGLGFVGSMELLRLGQQPLQSAWFEAGPGSTLGISISWSACGCKQWPGRKWEKLVVPGTCITSELTTVGESIAHVLQTESVLEKVKDCGLCSLEFKSHIAVVLKNSREGYL